MRRTIAAGCFALGAARWSVTPTAPMFAGQSRDGAFVAAWNRPDQFRRVITWIGSFGNLRGADRLPGLIRRTEPRPIRVFMQTGRQDLVNDAGSWYLENPRMAAALEFAGNDVRIELPIKPPQPGL
jgi:hypothetical protein